MISSISHLVAYLYAKHLYGHEGDAMQLRQRCAEDKLFTININKTYCKMIIARV